MPIVVRVPLNSQNNTLLRQRSFPQTVADLATHNNVRRRGNQKKDVVMRPWPRQSKMINAMIGCEGLLGPWVCLCTSALARRWQLRTVAISVPAL